MKSNFLRKNKLLDFLIRPKELCSLKIGTLVCVTKHFPWKLLQEFIESYIFLSYLIQTYVTELAGKNKYNVHRENDGKNKNSY